MEVSSEYETEAEKFIKTDAFHHSFRLHDGAFEYGASDTDKVVVLGEEYTLSKNSKNSFKGNDNLNGKKVIFHFSPSANRFWVTEDQKSVATSVSLSISPIETKLGNPIRTIHATLVGIFHRVDRLPLLLSCDDGYYSLCRIRKRE